MYYNSVVESLYLLPKSSCSCAFSVLIYIPTYSFIFKNVFYYSCIYIYIYIYIYNIYIYIIIYIYI